MYSSLHGLGVSLVSLASAPMSQLAVETDSNIIRHTTRALEAAELKWFGLNAKKHQILTINRQRIGCLAFCAVHGECTDSSRLPFGPVKYSTKVATATVNELRAVSIIISMKCLILADFPFESLVCLVCLVFCMEQQCSP